MTKNYLIKSLIVIVTLIYTANPANAQNVDPQQLFAEKMQQAATLTKEKKLPLALFKYLEIRQTFTGPELDYSIGRTYQRLHQCTDAIPYFQKVVNESGLKNNHTVLTRSKEALDEIKDCDNWPTVTLNCATLNNETLFIDDDAIGQCFIKTYTLPPGKHTFEVRSDIPENNTKKEINLENAPQAVALIPEKQPETKTKIETKEVNHYYKISEKFSPHLYWGLMTGGAAVLISSGFFAAMGYDAKADIQKYKDRNQTDKLKKPEDKLKLSKILMGTSLGVGGAVFLTGMTLAIISAVSEKKVDYTDSPLQTYIAPSTNGITFGLQTRF